VSGIVLDVPPTHPARQSFCHLTTLRAWRLISGMKILIAIDRMKNGHPNATTQWLEYTDSLQYIADTLPGVETFGRGCWLLPSVETLPLLETILYNTSRWKYPYRIAFLPTGLDIEIWQRNPIDKPIST
jgi:hypothetical protein